MAEHPDVTLVRRGYAAFSTGDVPTLNELIAQDAIHSEPGTSSMAGDYKGRQAILEFYGRVASETNGSFKIDLDRIYTDGKGCVVAVHRSTGQRAGKQLDVRSMLIFTVVDGSVKHIHGCQEDLAASDDFWA